MYCVLYDRRTYECEECGSNELYAEWEETFTEEVTETLPCTCERQEEFASQRISYVRTTNHHTAPLDEEDRIVWSDDECEEIDKEEEEAEEDIRCETCLESAEEFDWIIETELIDEESTDSCIRCAGCDREI
jgi:hypothetical protein